MPSVESTESMLLSHQCGDKKSSVAPRETLGKEQGNDVNRVRSAEVSQNRPKRATCMCVPVAGNQHRSQGHRHTSAMEEMVGPEGPLNPESPPPELAIWNQSLMAAGPQAHKAK